MAIALKAMQNRQIEPTTGNAIQRCLDTPSDDLPSAPTIGPQHPGSIQVIDRYWVPSHHSLQIALNGGCSRGMDQSAHRLLGSDMFRAIVVLTALIAVGCENQSQQPDFFARSQHDCAKGDEAACSMLDILLTYGGEGGTTNLSPASITQAERDANAIMDGMQRARSSQQAKQTRTEPATIHNR